MNQQKRRMNILSSHLNQTYLEWKSYLFQKIYSCLGIFIILETTKIMKKILLGTIRIAIILLHKFIMTENPQKSSKSQLKFADIQDTSLYSNHLNNSTSKMQYSLSKSPRFKENKKSQFQPKLYDLPTLRSNRSTSFGYGNKTDIGRLVSNTPPPNSYQIHSQFQKNKNKGIAIGLGRDMIKAVSAFGQKSFQVPAVGSYDIKEPTSRKKIGFSGRHVDLADKWIKQVPGPGSYRTLDLLDKNLKAQISKYQNARSHKFSRQQNKGQLSFLQKRKNMPGPAHYSSSHQSFETVGRFHRHRGASFGKSSRPDIANRSGVPGPGSYKHVTQFLH